MTFGYRPGGRFDQPSFPRRNSKPSMIASPRVAFGDASSQAQNMAARGLARKAALARLARAFSRLQGGRRRGPRRLPGARALGAGRRYAGDDAVLRDAFDAADVDGDGAADLKDVVEWLGRARRGR